MERGVNKHHFNWCARQWRMNTIHRRIREHPGMIMPLRVTIHNNLHEDIGPVKPPALTVARFILDGLLSPENNCDPMTNLKVQSERLFKYAEADRPQSDQAFKVAEHYSEQYDFLNWSL